MESQQLDILTRLANHDISVNEAHYQIEQLDKQYQFVDINLGEISGDDLKEIIDRIQPFVSTSLIEHLQTLNVISANEIKVLVAKNIDPDYVKELEYLGYTDLSENELVTLIMCGISPDFIWNLQSAGYSGVEVSMIITLNGLKIGEKSTTKLPVKDQLMEKGQTVDMKVQVSLILNRGIIGGK